MTCVLLGMRRMGNAKVATGDTDCRMVDVVH